VKIAVPFIEFFNFYCNIKILNALELEDYIAGVVEAEGGLGDEEVGRIRRINNWAYL
jgi:hypothetical protein